MKGESARRLRGDGSAWAKMPIGLCRCCGQGGMETPGEGLPQTTAAGSRLPVLSVGRPRGTASPNATEIGVPDPLEPEIDVIPEVEPVPGPVEVPEPVPDLVPA